MPEFDPNDENDAPQSDSLVWYLCDECENLHVQLRGENDELIASTILTREMLVQMIEAIDAASRSSSIRLSALRSFEASGSSALGDLDDHRRGVLVGDPVQALTASWPASRRKENLR